MPSVLLISLGLAPLAAADKLHFKFIGNEAFLVTDGKTALLSDFPYTPGAFGYMKYDFAAATDGLENGLCLITHGHADHFDPKLFAATKFAIIAPPAVLVSLDTPRKIPFAEEMSYRGIRVRALPTPHGDIQHYSYLVLWHGRKLYFAGDTDDIGELSRQSHLDIAFVTPWQLRAMKEHGKHIPAGQVVIYHHQVDEAVPLYQDRHVLQQGESFDLPFLSSQP
jgi:L-ascorbate metabolism protein UlaG (beta-lactamase superfamily)